MENEIAPRASTLSIVDQEAESLIIRTSRLNVLSGFLPVALVSHILPYLEASELVTVGATCKYFYRLSYNASLWRALYRYDFLDEMMTEDDSHHSTPGSHLSVQDQVVDYFQTANPDMDAIYSFMMSEAGSNLFGNTTAGLLPPAIQADMTTNVSPPNPPLPTSSSPSMASARNTLLMDDGGLARRCYEQRRKEGHTRMKHSSDDRRQLEASIRKRALVHKLEIFLDWSQLRIQPLVWLGGWFVSIVLFTEKLDGLNIPYWACAVPVSFAFLYCLGCVWFAHYLYNRRYNTLSIWQGMYSQMTGPTVTVYETLNRSVVGVAGLSIIILLGLLQFLLVILKLSEDILSPHTQRELAWVLVFLPIWIFFCLSCFIPMAFRNIDVGAFCLAIILLWIPAFIVMVGITVKLDKIDHALRMAYLLIPLFIYEGLLLVGSLLYLAVAIYQWRRGLYAVPNDAIALVISSFATLSPFLIFQVLLCVRDDRLLAHKSHVFPSATETITPILIVLGWCTCIGTYAAFTYRTPFQRRRQNTVADGAGLQIILSL